MALSKAAKKHLDAVADSAATLQLAAEEAANRLTSTVVNNATGSLVARVAMQQSSDSRRRTMHAAARKVRETQAQLQRDFAGAMREARSIAREFATRQVAVEAEPIIATATHSLILTPALPAHEVEAMWTEHAATAMARKFGSAAIAESVKWRAGNAPSGDLPRALGNVAQRVEAERQMHAVTQAVGAFNEAKREKWSELKEGRAKTLPGLPSFGASKGGDSKGDPFDSTREIWSAILDTRTCSVCWKLDGTMVKVGEQFPEGAETPLHARCRCSVITAFIPAEIEKYLPGTELDYESLKDDIKDYMGSRSFDVGQGVRHAKAFVDDALAQRGHSPVVLTERFNNRRDYFPNITRQRAPMLRW